MSLTENIQSSGGAGFSYSLVTYNPTLSIELFAYGLM